MGKIYKGQTKLTIRLETEHDLTNAKTVLIKYTKPSGRHGEWTATVDNVTVGTISYNPTTSDILNESGMWKIWSHVTFTDDLFAPGEPVNMPIYPEGK